MRHLVESSYKINRDGITGWCLFRMSAINYSQISRLDVADLAREKNHAARHTLIYFIAVKTYSLETKRSPSI